MTLDEYRKAEALSVSSLADLIGVTGKHKVRTVHRYLRHERVPALPVIQRITQVTNGRVTFDDFIHVAGGPNEC